MSDFVIQLICFVVFGLICVACYRVGLQDGKEYMLDFFNEIDGEGDSDERGDE